MIIPTLHVTDKETWIEIIDLMHPDDEPISEITMASLEDSIAMWYDLLTTYVDNFNMGYDVGYTAAYDEMDEEDD